MKVQNESVVACADTIKTNLEERIKKIMAIEYHYELEDFFNHLKSLPEEEQMTVLEYMINDYLQKIKQFGPDKILEVIEKRDLTDIVDFFDYDYIADEDKEMVKDDKFDFPVCKTKYKYTSVMEEADHTIYDLISKLSSKNGCEITLPISIENIIDFSINNVVPKKDMKKVIYWIILNLSVAYNYAINLNK